MVKMAYAPLPKLVPINASNMCPNNMAKIALSEVSYIVIVQIEKKMNKKVYYIIREYFILNVNICSKAISHLTYYTILQNAMLFAGIAIGSSKTSF